MTYPSRWTTPPHGATGRTADDPRGQCTRLRVIARAQARGAHTFLILATLVFSCSRSPRPFPSYARSVPQPSLHRTSSTYFTSRSVTLSGSRIQSVDHTRTMCHPRDSNTICRMRSRSRAVRAEW